MKVIAILALLMVAVSAEHYAVLVSGSKGFANYRHQADVCHAYQLLLSKGYSAENVIVMSYDDAASSGSNPYKNQLFNKPTDGPGVDVNDGCVIDYSKKDVTSSNYIEIITGGSPKGGNGRVLKSGPNDHVFLAFFDHGGAGLIAFPGSLFKNDYLHADKLLDAFNTMNSNKMYNQLTYYMEACESGSMFQNLNTPNVYALSAANPTESSWGTYCSPDDKVNGKSIGSCLGDLFSVNWMENSDAVDITKETLQSQFEIVYNETIAKSSVMQWGDLDFTSEEVSEFVGGSSVKNTPFVRKVRNLEERSKAAAVNSRDIQMHYLTNKFNKLPNEDNFSELQEEMNKIKFFTEKFSQVKSVFNLSGNIGITTDFECYRTVLDSFETQCGVTNDNSWQYFKYFYELCQNEVDMESTLSTINDICA